MIKLAENHAMGSLELREAYCKALMEEAERDKDIVLINCDLCGPMGLRPFAQRFPERAINVGIAEANACSLAGGMSAAGMIPFVNTFAVFASRRIYDQIFMCCAYAGQNVKIIGGDAGVSSAYNGGTHMAFEDVALLRAMPNVTILEPSDAVMMQALVHAMAHTYGLQYLRTARKKLPNIYAEGSTFTIGKAAVLREGADVTLMAYGLTVIEALKAASILQAEGISARVVDMFTVKPLDEACVLESAKLTGAIVTVENHQAAGGLGGAVCEFLAGALPAPVGRVGVQDVFGEVGTQDYLMERFCLTAPFIAAKAKAILHKKP